ncbi:hypothetical protein PF002_g11078 [Phytophthora fragariae]|uniref:Uncharacterized protein n=2 Tax=Phytophthora fragariae TaxID=53985 RepID=A0A6A3ZLQ8_9STRA|nr:hypothetical protein PF009_g11001 [Phytophthora fragariae]KAE9115583.1 hypothetical protein PF007_g9972 [Phytophthora fragariae]KAE9146023.1 hypothetical protein PF006_g9168 [Phytophthora fragariae]KAE9237019.1 hypothetical protein PF002_g11078 [Phytophthora fragariae]KAE9312705.1 hypothetical protein PF001_g9095 [Phytophthora fragariae]
MTGDASVPVPTTNTMQPPSADLKALLGSTRAMPKQNPSGPLPVLHTPTLTPSASAPRTQPSETMEFVANLDQIRIVDTQTSVRDGATLYVVEVYTLYQSSVHSNSTQPPLPTQSPSQIRQPVLSVGSRTSTTTPTTTSTSEHHEAPERAPDLCCRQFQTYARFHAAQPLWLVRVVTTKTQRKKILAHFLSDLADFAQSRAQRHRHCRLRQTLPKLIETFLSD